MRWLLDQGVPRSASARLKDWSEDAIHVGDLGMAAASDAAIIAHALSEDRIIVTLDADFHSLIATSGAAKPTVIRIREEGLKGDAFAELVLRIARRFPVDLEAGCLVTYSNGKVRLRALPLG
jgi:predicted nuclease of predicted toxin-antitoxin system